MKTGRFKFWALFALISCIALAGVLTGLHLRGRAAGSWLRVTAPVLSYATKEDGLHSLFAVTLSNIGRTDIEYQIRWFDCRARTNRAWTASARSSLAGRLLLPNQKTAKVTWDLGPNLPKDAYLCCGAFDWQQHPSWIWRAASKYVDPPLIWIQNCIQPGWKSYTWSLAEWVEPLADGIEFTSNISVDDYFRQLYGLERVKGAPDSSTRSSSANQASDQSGTQLLPASVEIQRAFNSYCIAKSQETAPPSPGLARPNP